MRIAVDTQALFSPYYKGRGIGNFVLNQLEELFRQDGENEYVLFNVYSGAPALGLFQGKIPHGNVSEFHLYAGFLLEPLEADGRFTFEELFKSTFEKFLQEEMIDLFFLASPFDRWCFFEPGWFENVQLAATVYDVIPHLEPDRYLADPLRKAEYYRNIEVLRAASMLFVISASVKTDLVERLAFDAARIEVVYAGIAPFFTNTPVTPERQKQLWDRYGITGEYILLSAGTDPRKNMPESVEAYCGLPRQVQQKYQLVVVCWLDDYNKALLKEKLAARGGRPDGLVITGFVPDEDLADLYRLARLTLFASRYEGFGLPVIESMACGTPVVTSNNSSLGEIAAGAAVLVDPFDIKSITKGLQEGLEGGTDYTVQMAEKVARFTWPACVATMLRGLGHFTPLPHTSPKPVARCTIKHLAVFTPLPPVTSGIADYAYDILPVLAQHVEQLDVFIDTGYTPRTFSCEGIRILPYTDYAARREMYDRTLFQMGNSGYHDYMIGPIREFGGVIELHDVNLHAALQDKAFFIEHDPTWYREIIAADYPDKADVYLHQFTLGQGAPSPYTLCLNRYICSKASSIIVHSEYARELVKKMNMDKHVDVVPLYAPEYSGKTKVEAREAVGIEQDTMMIASFGAVALSRRLETVLQVVAELLPEFPKLRLYITGGDDKGEKIRLEALVESMGLQGIICFTGRLEEQAFNDYLKASDIVVNLRWPYTGESSAIVTRVLAAGRPVVTTNIGSFSELPDKCVAKIPTPSALGDHKKEKNALREALRDLLADPQKCEKMGRAGMEYANKELSLDHLRGEIYDILRKNQKSSNLNKRMLRKIALLMFRAEKNTPGEMQKVARFLAFHV